jgi:hypothetical protein
LQEYILFPIVLQEEDRKGGQGNVMGPFDPVTPDGPTNKPTSLFTNEGLQASYKDLDQIFDNSDDTSSDETVSIWSLHIAGVCAYRTGGHAS